MKLWLWERVHPPYKVDEYPVSMRKGGNPCRMKSMRKW